LDAARTARWLSCFLCFGVIAQEAPKPTVFHLGPDIVPPFVTAKVKPEYTDQGRLAKLEGSVLLSVVVEANGKPGNIHVERPLGLGLDQAAIESVGHWGFTPAMKAGTPVAVQVNEEVFFRPERTLWDWHAVRVILRPPDGAAQPELIQTKFPATVQEEENASVTVAFDVDPKGVPANVRAIKSSNAKWEPEVIAAVRSGWRFRPAKINGKPVAASAWFELIRGSHSPIPPAPIPPASAKVP
jgi:TonB family protein